MKGIIRDTIEGVTTSSYGDNTLEFNCRHRNYRSISVVNGDSTLDLMYKIIAYFDNNEVTEKTLKSETTLSAGDSYNLMVNLNQFDHIKVFVKSSTKPLTYYVAILFS